MIQHVIESHGLQKGLACKYHSSLINGSNYGENFVNIYKYDIVEFFNMWSADRNGKISASLIKDAIHAKYPNNFDYQNIISSLP